MANAFTYVGSAQNSGSGTTLTIGYTPTTGNLVMLGIIFSDGTQGITSVVDSGGNTWVDQGVIPNAFGAAYDIQQCNTVGTPFTTVTITFGGSTSICVAMLAEYSGAFGGFTNPQQRSFSNTGSFSPITERSITYANTITLPTYLLQVGFFFTVQTGQNFLGPDVGGNQRQAICVSNIGIAIVDNFLDSSSSPTSSFPPLSETVSVPTVHLDLIGNVWASADSPCNVQASSSSLTFNGTVGASNPAPQDVTISNIGGGGSQAFEAIASTAWLLPADLVGNTDQIVSVSVDTTGLTSGTYSGHLTIFTEGCGTPVVNVTLVVTPATPMGTCGKALTKVDTWDLDNGQPDWSYSDSVPIAWYDSNLGQQKVGITRPSQNGAIGLLYIQLAQTLTGSGIALTVPDDWTPYVLWGALSDLLGHDGPAFDPVRAKYCQTRYEEGVEMARLILKGA